MQYLDNKRMKKTAAGTVTGAVAGLTGLFSSLGGLVSQAAQVPIWLLITAAGLTGTAAGASYAALTSKSKQDVDTVKKKYQDQRLSAQIGRLSSNLNSQYRNFKNRAANKLKAARIIQ